MQIFKVNFKASFLAEARRRDDPVNDDDFGK